MKKLLTTLFMLVLAVSCFAFTATVQNVESFSSKAGPAGEIFIAEDFAGELSGVTMTVTLTNSALWYTVTDSNLVSNSYKDSGVFPSALGIIGTNRIIVSFPVYSPLDPVVVRLTNVWINSQYFERETDATAKFSAVVYGYPIERSGVVLAHWTPSDDPGGPVIPLDKTYLKYFSCVGKWWTGAVLINDTGGPVDVQVKFTLEDGTGFTNIYTVAPGTGEVLPLYADPRIQGHSGYIRATVPPGCGFNLLIGDGNQMSGL